MIARFPGMTRLARVVCMTALAVCMALPVAAAPAKQQAKYIFMFIGDGMGIPQRTAAEQFQGKPLAMNTFPVQGIASTDAVDRFITDSGAAATSMASGVKTLAEMARDRGMKVAILSSVSIDHATPACFYAHVPSRGGYHEIDIALANSGFDFFGGGGMRDPDGARAKKKDESFQPLGDAVAIAKEKGYKIITNKQDFMALKPSDGKVIAWNDWQQDAGALPYQIDTRDEDINIAEFTEKAIEMVDNPKGFFMMVEGGKIDWACHANDAAAAIHDTLVFDQAVQKAVDFAKKHPNDTLILVAGDHECGGLTLGYAGTKYDTDFEVLGAQKISFQKFDDDIFKDFQGDFEAAKALITEHFGLKFEGDAQKDVLVLSEYQIKLLQDAFEATKMGKKERDANEETYVLYGGYNPLGVAVTHVLNQKAGLSWTSFSHTGVPISVSAMGPGAEKFTGSYHLADIALRTMEVMGEPGKPVIMESATAMAPVAVPATVAVK
ncbi:MAG: alkaline phosphatase [Desulfovibrio sp.]|nr:alkaline phosphatase [Desulfovibrio sp.]